MPLLPNPLLALLFGPRKRARSAIFLLSFGAALMFAFLPAARAQERKASPAAGAIVYCYDQARGVVLHVLASECRGTILSEDEARAKADARDEQLRRAVAGPPRANRDSLQRTTVGSAFYVDDTGRLVTSYHIVNACTLVSVTDASGSEQSATTLAVDTVRDLALLSVDGKSPARPYFPDEAAISADAFVAVVGHRDPAAASADADITIGKLLAISQRGAPTEQMVITADIRARDSGSPVLDRRGLVIGMLTDKTDLDQIRVGKGPVRDPKNTALAITLSPLQDFLDRYDTRYRVAQGGPSLEIDKIVASARSYVARVDCWR